MSRDAAAGSAARRQGGHLGPDEEGVPAARSDRPWWRLSGGEIHFLWSFIDGSIMNVDTRITLRRAWGMCPRHSFGFLSVDAAFRSGYLHGPAVLYEDLMWRAVAALRPVAVLEPAIAARRIRDRGTCLMCSLGYGSGSQGRASPEVLDRGADVGAIHRFAAETSAIWKRWVCGRCEGTEGAARCRLHLREEMLRGRSSIEGQRALVSEIARHVRRYARSFRWELRGTATAEDRAALVGSVGWCSGWSIWLDFTQASRTGQSGGGGPGEDPAWH
jgi:hypothetical protein